MATMNITYPQYPQGGRKIVFSISGVDASLLGFIRVTYIDPNTQQPTTVVGNVSNMIRGVGEATGVMPSIVDSGAYLFQAYFSGGGYAETWTSVVPGELPYVSSSDPGTPQGGGNVTLYGSSFYQPITWAKVYVDYTMAELVGDCTNVTYINDWAISMTLPNVPATEDYIIAIKFDDIYILQRYQTIRGVEATTITSGIEGTLAAGSSYMIYGTNFGTDTTMTIAGILLSVTFIQSNRVSATLPYDVPGGTHTLEVSRPTYQSSSYSVVTSARYPTSIWSIQTTPDQYMTTQAGTPINISFVVTVRYNTGPNGTVDDYTVTGSYGTWANGVYTPPNTAPEPWLTDDLIVHYPVIGGSGDAWAARITVTPAPPPPPPPVDPPTLISVVPTEVNYVNGSMTVTGTNFDIDMWSGGTGYIQFNDGTTVYSVGYTLNSSTELVCNIAQGYAIGTHLEVKFINTNGASNSAYVDLIDFPPPQITSITIDGNVDAVMLSGESIYLGDFPVTAHYDDGSSVLLDPISVDWNYLILGYNLPSTDVSLVSRTFTTDYSGQFLFTAHYGGFTAFQQVYLTVNPSLLTVTPSTADTTTNVTVTGLGFLSAGLREFTNFQARPEDHTRTASEVTNTSVVFKFNTNVPSPVLLYLTYDEDYLDNPSVTHIPYAEPVPLPIVTDPTPHAAAPGDTITITALNLDQSSKAFLTAREIEVISGGQGFLNVRIPADILQTQTFNLGVSNASGFSNAWEFTVNVPVTEVPILNNVDPSTLDRGQNIDLFGTRFGTVTGKVYINGTIECSVVSWSDTRARATIPTEAPAGWCVILVANAAGPSNYLPIEIRGLVEEPIITDPTPHSATSGEQFEITGEKFELTPGSVLIQPPGPVSAHSCNIVSWTFNKIVITFPPTVAQGTLSVMAPHGISNGWAVVVDDIIPKITFPTPTKVEIGQEVNVYGSNFVAEQKVSAITEVGYTPELPMTFISSGHVKVTLPSSTFNVAAIMAYFTAADNTTIIYSNPWEMRVQGPIIESITPGIAVTGSNIVIGGNDFGSSEGSVQLINYDGRVTVPIVGPWDTDTLEITIPVNQKSSLVLVTDSYGIISNLYPLEIEPAEEEKMAITTVNPQETADLPGTLLVYGTKLSEAASVSIGGIDHVFSIVDDHLEVSLPEDEKGGVVTAKSQDESAVGPFLTIKDPELEVLYPSSIDVSTLTTEYLDIDVVCRYMGSSGTFFFGNLAIKAATKTQTGYRIRIPKSDLVATADIWYTTGTRKSNRLRFTITGYSRKELAAPVIDSISTSLASYYSDVEITGRNFGTSKYNGQVLVGGIVLPDREFKDQAGATHNTIVSWSDSRIIICIPEDFKPGDIQIKVVK